MIKSLSKFLSFKPSSSIFSKISPPFSNLASDEEEYLVDEIVDDLYETHLKEEFTSLYSTKYSKILPGYATSKGTQHYSSRSSSSTTVIFPISW